MTGAGTCAVDVPAGRIEAEARSVNHRFLKVSLHLSSALGPSSWPSRSARARRSSGATSRSGCGSRARARPRPRPSRSTRTSPRRRRSASRRSRPPAGRGWRDTRDVMTVPGAALDAAGEAVDEAVTKGALAVLEGAIDALTASRSKEGGHLADECRAILDRVAAAAKRLEARAPELPELHRDRLAARLATLLDGSGVAPDPAQLAREVAGFADRCDVAEGSRASPTSPTPAICSRAAAPWAWSLDFLIQEFHREANTLGSKSPDAEMTAVVIGSREGRRRAPPRAGPELRVMGEAVRPPAAPSRAACGRLLALGPERGRQDRGGRAPPRSAVRAGAVTATTRPPRPWRAGRGRLPLPVRGGVPPPAGRRVVPRGTPRSTAGRTSIGGLGRGPPRLGPALSARDRRPGGRDAPPAGRRRPLRVP